MTTTILPRQKIFFWLGVSLVVLASLFFFNHAQAYTYNSYEVTDLSITASTTALDATADYTVSFTAPMEMTTSTYFYIYFPYLYKYTEGEYNYDYPDVTNATITSSQLTYSYGYYNYIYLYPSSTISSGATVSFTVNGVTNPSIEGTGSFSIYGYEYSSDYYNYFYGSASQVYGTVDLTITMYDSDGETPVSNVYVYLYYYSYSGSTYDYEYSYGYTDSNGEIPFAGLTDGRTYTVYFYYWGDETDADPPSSATLTFSAASAPMSQSYNFVEPNVITYFKDKDGNAINNAYWYLYKTDYTDYYTDYVWRYGYTDSSGTISAAVDKAGSYIVYAYYNNNYYSDEFTVSSSLVAEGLANPLQIPAPEVSGQVKAGDSGASSVYIWAHDDSWRTYRYTYTDSDGWFEFAFGTSNTYIIEVSSWGLPSGYFAPDDIEVSVTAGTVNNPITIELVAATKTISGTVTMEGDSVARVKAGTPVTDAYIYWYQSGGNYNYTYTYTDSIGQFSSPVIGGTWYGYVYQQTWPATWAYTGDTLKAVFGNDNTAETATFNIQVTPYNSHITGTMVYPDGTHVGYNEVYLYAYGPQNVYSYAYTDSNGYFDLKTTAGTFNVYAYFSWSSASANNYGPPTFDFITLEAGETVNLGNVSLIEKTAHITGTITLNDGSAMNNQSVYAYNSGSPWDYGYDCTDENGYYDIAVVAGDWTVYTYTWGQTTDDGKKIIFAGSPKYVTVAENETVSGQDFLFSIADATINFLAQDSSGNDLNEEYGWASVYEDTGGSYGWYSTGCYVYGGQCSVDVASDVAYSVNYYSYSSWGWYYGDDESETYTFSNVTIDGTAADTATFTSDETQDVVLVMALNDVTVSGQFLDADGNEVEIDGEVYASNDSGGWTYTWIDDDSSYELKLSAGTWYLGYWTWGNWSSYDYWDGTENKITVASGDTVDFDFHILVNDATISGQVLDPDGNAVTSPVFVKASVRYGESETETAEDYGLIEQTTYTDNEGNFSMIIPSGTYYITVSSADYLDPQAVQVIADTAGSAENLVLQFLSSDAVISGTVVDGVGITLTSETLAIGDPTDAFVYAYSLAGSSVNTIADTDGSYDIEATLGDTWYVGAVKQVGTAYYYSDQLEVVVDEATETQDISLTHSATLPAAQTVQFDPQDAAVVTLEDGTEINMPANSITAEDVDQVTVLVEPVAEISHDPDTEPVDIGYEATATDEDGNITTDFSSNVTITILYSETEFIEAELTEDDLEVGYYDDAAGAWENADSYVVNTEANEVVVTTDHFSKFAIVSGRSIIQQNRDEDGDGQGDLTEEEIEEELAQPENFILTAPENLRATKRQAKAVTLEWNEVSVASSYEVQVINVKKNKEVKTVSAAETTKQIKKLKANKKYNFKVRSLGETGSTSGWTDLTKRTKPAAPKLLKAKKLTTTGATLKWKKSLRTIKKYLVRIYSANGKLVKKLKTKKVKTKVTGLTAGTEYFFKVKAKFNKNNISKFSKKKTFTTLK